MRCTELSRSFPRRSALLAAAAVMALLALPAVAGSPASVPVSAQTGGAAAYVLWGSATKGWGNASGAETNPGPTLFAYPGQNVSLYLYADDGTTHNWTLDLNRDGKMDAGDLFSPDFSSASKPVVFNFTMPANLTGPLGYRCGFHQTTMTGTLVVLTPPSVTLHGGAAVGWGPTNSTAKSPGPTLYVLAGSNLTLYLYSIDGSAHDFFVDYNNNNVIDGSEKNTTAFSSPTAPLVVNYTIPATVATGNYTYRCHFHPNTMYGSILVYNTAAVQKPGPGLPLVPTIMVVTIVVVLILAAVYQVRAVRAARRPK